MKGFLMPIVTPEITEDSEFYERLSISGAAVIAEGQAMHQDARPARIGLLNLMPAPVMEETELRWMRFISHTVLQIEPVLLKFDDDCREKSGSSREHILQRYRPFSEVKEHGLDGLIITGDNQELSVDGRSLMPFEDLNYFKQLTEAVDWAGENVSSTIFSCLASHFALYGRHGINRKFSGQKTFGVFRHNVVDRNSQMTFAMDDTISAPHSRWGQVDVEDLINNDVNPVAVSNQVGWLLAEEPNETGGSDIYLQGHPEYWRSDLHQEYLRDKNQIPENYYEADNPENIPVLSWSNDARAILSNWISRIYDSYSMEE
jgi:homoserine O-succinyltransferase